MDIYDLFCLAYPEIYYEGYAMHGIDMNKYDDFTHPSWDYDHHLAIFASLVTGH